MSLPTELYRDIVDQVKDEDILPLLGVCSAFRIEAQRRVYGSITLKKHNRTRFDRVASRWIESLQVIAKFVRYLDLEAMDESDKALTQHLPIAYGELINLKWLNIPAIETGVSVPPISVPFRLLSFRSQILSSTSTLLKEKLIPFLDAQPSIRELNLFCDHSQPVSPNLLPNLSTLSAATPFAFQLLPGRSVTHLFLYVSPRGALSSTTPEDVTTLRSLSLDKYNSLRTYEFCFPTLEFLELNVVSHSCSILLA